MSTILENPIEAAAPLQPSERETVERLTSGRAQI